MFAKGDLIYIPQDAVLYGLGRCHILVNPKPKLALFLKYDDHLYSTIVLNGQEWLVKSNDIYPNRSEAC